MKRIISAVALTFIAVCVMAQSNLPNFAAPDTDLSGSISTGGQYQTVQTQQNVRHSIDFFNVNASDTCYLHFGSDVATANNSIKVIAGKGYIRVSGPIPNEAIQVTCTTTGDHFYLKVQ